MRDFFEGQPVMDFFTENFKEIIEHLYQYYLSMKIDSSAVRKIYFAISDSSPDFSRKVLTVFSWLSVHFDSKTDSSKLFQKIDSSFEGNANRILENAPSSLPSVQISGKVLYFLENLIQCAHLHSKKASDHIETRKLKLCVLFWTLF